MERMRRYGGFLMPRTVDAAVTILISDLSARQIEAIGYMSDELFEALCRYFAPTMQDDFRLWSGNDQLLMDCLDKVDDTSGTDPMTIIMTHMRVCLTFNKYGAHC